MMEQQEKDWGAEIGKIRKGDKIIITLISEPLQEKYIEILKKREEQEELIEKMKALYDSPVDMPDADARQIHLLNYEAGKLRADFWFSLNDQYNLWKSPAIGIRNGFCIVKTLGPEDFIKRLKQVFDEFGEELGEI